MASYQATSDLILEALGRFKTVEEAQWCYVQAKAALLRGVAETQPDSRVRDGLHRHARVLEETIR